MGLMGFVSVQRRGGVPKLTGSCGADCSHSEFCHCRIMFLVQKVSLDCAHQSLMVEPSSRYRPPISSRRTVPVTEPACDGGEGRCSECSGLQASPRGSDPVSQTRFEAGVIRERVCHLLLLSSRVSPERSSTTLRRVRHLHCQD